MGNEGGSWARYQELVLRLLEQHDEKLEELTKQLSDSQSDRLAIRSLIENLQRDSAALRILVKEGTLNHPPLVDRVDSLEKKIDKLIEEEAKRTTATKENAGFKKGVFIAVAGTILTITWEIVKFFFIH